MQRNSFNDSWNLQVNNRWSVRGAGWNMGNIVICRIHIETAGKMLGYDKFMALFQQTDHCLKMYNKFLQHVNYFAVTLGIRQCLT